MGMPCFTSRGLLDVTHDKKVVGYAGAISATNHTSIGKKVGVALVGKRERDGAGWMWV